MQSLPSDALLVDPMAVAAFLATVPAVVFWLSGLPSLRKLFQVTSPILYVYFIPTLCTTFGITPSASPTYDWMIKYLLPIALILLMITVDLPAIARLGKMALLMMLVGTSGIVLGGPIALLVFHPFLPEDTWRGFAALSGSWIGGPSSMIAMAESVGTPPSAFGPVVVVDAVVGYGWMGVLLFLSAYQRRFDAWIGARTEAIEQTNRRLADFQARRRPIQVQDAVMLLGVGLAGGVLALEAGDQLPPLGDPTIISHTTWAVLLMVTIGLALSFTAARRLDEAGASSLGTAALYLLVTAIGAQADLRAIVNTPLYLAAGGVWVAIHVGLLLLAARLVRAPLFFVATASMANIGGPVSAPIVAGVYHAAMAPVGLLMAVTGEIVGIYAALGCAWLLAVVAG